jgi:tetratricopeptide (TPR) repeat protein
MHSLIIALLLAGIEPVATEASISGDDGEAAAAEQVVTAINPETVADILPLQEIDLLVAAGAPQLALRLLGEVQPDYSSDADGWRQHERVRVEILRRSGQWSVLADRMTELPSSLSLADKRWTTAARIQALLELQQHDAALALVRPLIWSPNSVSQTELMNWRRLLIRALRGNGDIDAASAAIRRFQQDYADESRGWLLERARLAIEKGADGEAVVLLAESDGPDAEILKIVADFRSGDQPAAGAIKRAVKLGVDKSMNDGIRREAWAVAAEAAGSINNHTARIAALERGLVLPRSSQPTLAPLSADALWDDYLELGTELGNELQLIVGDDEAWFVAASNRYDDQPIHARALFAVVALKANHPRQREVAHWQFAQLLDQVPSGDVLMQALYLDSARFPEPSFIPALVRYLLLEHVLAIPDIPLASELLQGLESPPPETDPFSWQLRRARVLLLGGNIDAGIAALEQLFDTVDDTAEDYDRDKVLQVVFDLQTLDQHAAALDFIERLAASEDSLKRQRELWFWRADSLAELGRSAEAARAYLRSALLLDPLATDPWAQTARFRAAEEMLAAGLYADARRQFRNLLNSTRDAGRQAVIRNRLQELELRAGNAAPDDSRDRGGRDAAEMLNDPASRVVNDMDDDETVSTRPLSTDEPSTD